MQISNSALATFISRTSGNYMERSEGTLVSKIMIHNANASGDRYDMQTLINSGTSGYHYGISTDGVVGLFTDECRAALGCNDDSINDVCVHIIVFPNPSESKATAEAASTSTSRSKSSGTVSSVRNKASRKLSEKVAAQLATSKDPSQSIYNATLAANTASTTLKETNSKLDSDIVTLLVNLVEDICRRNFIRECTYSPNDRKNSTIICHSWYDGSTDCPGKLDKYFGEIASAVSSKLKTARLATETESLKARNSLPVGATKPFMVVPDATATSINYDQLRELGVIGTMIWGGGWYDANRNKRKSYANSNINIQVENAKKYDMPWAIYVDVRSRNASEARAECKEVWYVISKHSPKLGLWLHLDFSKISGTAAVEIINIYYDKILEWGLKGRCGLYADLKQARLINWPQWTDKFAFWWIAMLDSVESLDSILTPSMFQVR